MSKIFKTIRIILLIIFLIIIFILMLWQRNITTLYKLPTWLIPGIIFISFFYICYKYIKDKLNEGKLEEEMISIINHTFRTPLTNIIWQAKELENNIPQNEKLLYLQNINNSTNKVLSIIDILVGIKNINNRSGYYFEAISLREIIEKSIKKYRDKITKKNITFRVSTFKEMPLLTVDLNKISFVIDTIMENAISYTNQNGKILIDCITSPQKLTLFISDTGIGLNFTDKIKIFSKFYRNKKAKLMNTDGLGLRLYLSRQIIKQHRGRIYVKSNGLNEGATFFVELPFKK